MMGHVDIATPDDWHVHLRDDSMLEAVAPFTASMFRYALVMPNLVPPVRTASAAEAYRARIVQAAGEDASSEFTPLMAVYFSQLTFEDLRSGFERGQISAVKYYPAGATTNSASGGKALIDNMPMLEGLASLGLPLLVHAEAVDPRVDIFAREAAFLESELKPICNKLPELRITVEHISTRVGVDFVTAHPTVGATITPHHLACDRSDLLANGLRPALYCKPVINSADDRLALVQAATSGSGQFFLGTDSAPHPSSQKMSEVGLPGIFNAPNAIAVVAEVFHGAGKLESLEAFMSLNGAKHYGLARAAGQMCLHRTERTIDEAPMQYVTTADGQRIRVFGETAALHWTIGPTSREHSREPRA